MRYEDSELKLLIHSRRVIAENIVELVLRGTDNEQLPRWEPGC